MEYRAMIKATFEWYQAYYLKSKSKSLMDKDINNYLIKFNDKKYKSIFKNHQSNNK